MKTILVALALALTMTAGKHCTRWMYTMQCFRAEGCPRVCIRWEYDTQKRKPVPTTLPRATPTPYNTIEHRWTLEE